MTVGDEVVFAADPLRYGLGEIDAVLADGRLEVVFDRDDERHAFHPQELEVSSRARWIGEWEAFL